MSISKYGKTTSEIADHCVEIFGNVTERKRGIREVGGGDVLTERK